MTESPIPTARSSSAGVVETAEPKIERAAVLGAGVMGAAIAAHLANAGIETLLLDMKPEAPTDLEASRGLSRDSHEVANRFATAGLARAQKSKPANFYSRALSRRVTVGNFEDDLESLADVDWVIEAVVENLEIKRSLFGRIARHLRSDVILSTNTSGLSSAALSECLPVELRSRFLVTHFFNPPRYLKLLELVPGPETDADLLASMAAFGERRLGKGIVYAKDTPNFIANRIGTYAMLHGVRFMIDEGYSIVEVDKLTGRAIGRPKSATFRTADLVGLDTLLHVAGNMYESLPEDPERDLFEPPEFVREMIERRWLGEKTRQGFYKKTKVDGKSEILMLDPASMDYVPQPKVGIPSLEMAKNIDDVSDRIRALVAAPDRAGTFLRENLQATLLYAARSIPEISEDVLNVDRALRWGFGWELGPFEIWDAIGVRRSCDEMSKAGIEIPPLTRELLDSGAESFYERSEGEASFFDLRTKTPTPVPRNRRTISLADRKDAGHAVFTNPDASLVDIGDGVVCLEFSTKMNTIGPGIIDLLFKSIDLVEEGEWHGLVIGNGAENFSVGANLLLVLNEIDDDNLDDVDWMVRRFQDANQRVRFSQKPVVVAPHGLTLGGGCEVVLGADRVCAAAETYIGLVELGAGVIPAGGGCKEMIKRVHERVPVSVDADLFPFVRAVFETIGLAQVATSAVEAQELGYLREDDVVVLNRDHLLYEAKQRVLALHVEGYEPGRPLTDIRVLGEPGLAAIRAGIHNMRAGGFITEYEAILGDKLAWVLCGGEVSPASRVSEQYLLDLEREAFMTLCEDPRTQARMEHILKTGKPLRN